jgi:DNA-binding response OmpR family regulator
MMAARRPGGSGTQIIVLHATGRSGGPDDAPLRAGALHVDPARHEVTCDGRVVDCTPGEFHLLETMAAAPGRVFTRAQLLARLNGFDRYVTDRTVDTHVVNLRKKIEPDPRRPRRLLTVYGVGYKLSPLPAPPADG